MNEGKTRYLPVKFPHVEDASREGFFCAVFCPLLWDGRCHAAKSSGGPAVKLDGLGSNKVHKDYIRMKDCPLKAANELGIEDLDI